MTVPVRVKPGASRTKVGGHYEGPFGAALIVAVHAPAVDGRATTAVLKAVAAAIGVRTRDISVRTGHTSRDKLLVIERVSPAIADRIRELLAH